MKENIKVLAIDDDADILLSLKLMLKNQIQSIITESDPEKALNMIERDDFDVILLDMNFSKDTISGQEGFDLLSRIRKIKPEAVVIFLTAYGDMDKAIKALKAGAVDFILKPWQNEKLLATVFSAAQISQSRKETLFLKEKQEVLQAEIFHPFSEIIGQSDSMKEIIRLIQKVGPTDANVLITGENGTGKELIARAIYQCSARKQETFLSVDLGSIPESLFESELFGHCKGSFTDAKSDRMGRFQAASGGTLFLDEIGNLNLTQQSKLLTAIEKQQIVRVGANHPIPINIRIICATNLPLVELQKEDRFRQDLLYRINTIEIHLPPLRERKSDIPLLSQFYLMRYKKKYNKLSLSLMPDTLEFLQNYKWPGNIRELIHSVERAVILADNDQIRASDFSFLKQSSQTQQQTPQATDLSLTLSLEEIKKNRIIECLNKNHFNVSLCAKELGLTRSALYRRMEKYGL